jgi:hypothetical protein
MLEAERWEYRRACNDLTEEELKWEGGHEMFLTPFGVSWRTRSGLDPAGRQINASHRMSGPEELCGPDPGPNHMVTDVDDLRSDISFEFQQAMPTPQQCRQLLDHSLVTELDDSIHTNS